MNDKNLLILGAGQYGAIVYEIAEAMGSFEKIDFLDDSKETEINSLLCDAKVIGTMCELEKFAGEYRFGIVAIGDPELRYRYTAQLEYNCYQIPILIHPRAFIGKYARLHKGCVVEAMAVIQSGSELGMGVFVSAGAVVNHCVYVGDFCHLDTGSVVSAHSLVKIGTKLVAGEVFSGVDDLTLGGIRKVNEELNALDLNPDWI